MTAWDAEPRLLKDTGKWLSYLEGQGVFFSSPLDLDFAMMTAFPQAYAVEAAELVAPTEAKINSVLGESHGAVDQYEAAQQTYFGPYHKRFKVGSKPVWHIRAMGELDDAALVASLPGSLKRLTEYALAALKAIPE